MSLWDGLVHYASSPCPPSCPSCLWAPGALHSALPVPLSVHLQYRAKFCASSPWPWFRRWASMSNNRDAHRKGKLEEWRKKMTAGTHGRIPLFFSLSDGWHRILSDSMFLPWRSKTMRTLISEVSLIGFVSRSIAGKGGCTAGVEGPAGHTRLSCPTGEHNIFIACNTTFHRIICLKLECIGHHWAR